MPTSPRRARRRGTPLPPSVREVATRSVDGGREIIPSHPRCSSVREGLCPSRPVVRPHPRCSFRRGGRLCPPVCHGSAVASNQRERSAPQRGVLLPPAAKVPKNAVQTCGLKIPYAPTLVVYPVRFYHANTVPCKFPPNLASSLLLFSLPLLP